MGLLPDQVLNVVGISINVLGFVLDVVKILENRLILSVLALKMC